MDGFDDEMIDSDKDENLKSADLDVHGKGVEPHGANKSDPACQRVHQILQKLLLRNVQFKMVLLFFVGFKKRAEKRKVDKK